MTGPAIATVSVTLGKSTLSIGDTTTATVSIVDVNGAPVTDCAVTWNSFTPSIATVSSTGLVTAVGAGATVILAACQGIDGSKTVTVRVPVASVTVSLGSSQIAVGATTQATATLKDASGATLSGRTVTWSSGTTSVATVNSLGVVTAAGVGTSVITATSEGKSGTAIITAIVNAPGAFNLSLPSNRTIDNSTKPGFAWTSSSGATSYTLEVATTSSFGSTDVLNQSVTTTSFTPTTALAEGTVYFWKVTAVNAGGSVAATNAAFELAVPLSAGTNPEGVAITPDGTKLLATGSDTVTIVSLATHQITTRIPMSFHVKQVTIRPDGLQAVVTGSNQLGVIDLTTNTVVKTIAAPCIATTLYDIAYTPDGLKVVLPDLSSSCTKEGMDIVTLSSGSTVFVDLATSDVGQSIAVMPNGTAAFVTGSSAIKRVDLSSNAVLTLLTPTPLGIAILPDNSAAIYINQTTAHVNKLDFATNTATSIATVSNNSSAHIVAITPDGTKAVVSCYFNIYVIQLSNGAVLANYPSGAGTIAISPDGKYAYGAAGFGSGSTGNVRVVRIP